MKTLATAVIGMAVLSLGAHPVDAQSNNPNVMYGPALLDGLEYRSVGPSRGGRVTAVAGHRAQPHTFFMGATGGGVWKTTDYGTTWRPISDGYFATGSIGAIQVADSDPNIVYVGTGSDGIRSNVIVGRGIYKSADAGKTWMFIGLRDVGQIGAVEVHPTNPNLVYVAAIGDPFRPTPDRGVYRSADGGTNWDKVLFVSDSTGAVDLEFAPDNPREIYASMWRGERKPWTIISGAREGGIYKSTDGGDTWTKLTNGLPQGLFGKSDLAVSPADPGRVYALIEAVEPEDGLYRSDDRGMTWRQVTSYNPILNRPFYYTGVDADPTNADIVYASNEGFYKSTDGGENFERRPTPHGDNHDMWINPDDPNIIVQSNDGGANVTLDGGETWSSQHNQPTAELYQVAVDDQFPYWLYAGQQDNTTIRVPSRPPHSAPGGHTAYWEEVGGCETGPVVPKPGNADIVYANCKGRFGRYSHLTGQEQQFYVGMTNIYGHNPGNLEYRFQRVSPIHVSPHNPDVVYHASQYLHRTMDDGVTWETISPDLTAFDPEFQVVPGTPITRDITGEEYYSTIYAVEESRVTPGLIWVGANDGPVHVTQNAGQTWTDVTPDDIPFGGRVQTIEPSRHRAAKAYVAIYRYLMGDWAPYIYKTENYGESWTRLTNGTNGIPHDTPTRVIREDPDREGLLYAGTEFGMYVSFDDGAHWQPFQQNLPVTPITDIKIVNKDLVMSTMGRGFWVMDDVSPLHQLGDQVASAPAHLFAPRDAYRMRYGGGFGFGGPTPDEPEFPDPGATIDYYLAQVPSGPVTLEILDAGGSVLRTFTSEAPPQTVQPAPPTMREFQYERLGGPRLETNAGTNRFTWDLTVPGPWDDNPRRSGSNGPMVEPGSYQVRLTAGNVRQTRSLTVRMDPRVLDDGVTREDVAAQLALSLRIRDDLSAVRMAAARVEEARNGLTPRNDRASRQLDQRLKEVEDQLVTADAYRYPKPMLIDQYEYLYGNLTRADQRPGQDAYARFEFLHAELERHLAALEELLTTDSAAQD
jgi:photosystem II stability/assembly factor-like uncharacterized protein